MGDICELDPKLSAIMAISRLFIVTYAAGKRKRMVQGHVQEGVTREEAEDNSPSYF